LIWLDSRPWGDLKDTLKMNTWVLFLEGYLPVIGFASHREGALFSCDVLLHRKSSFWWTRRAPGFEERRSFDLWEFDFGISDTIGTPGSTYTGMFEDTLNNYYFWWERQFIGH
jgi:hypothetical protein